MTRKTVFVVGAGASKEANLPTGYELKGEISRLLDIRFDWRDQKSGDYLITQALRNHVREHAEHPGDINPYIHEAWHIRDALPQAISIDNLIDSQRGNEKLALCGKLAIVRSILAAEHKSLLYFQRDRADSNISFKTLSESWYLPFFQLLTENCCADDLDERFKNVALIVFNYDRCIEHFLKNALQNYYRIPDAKAAELVGSIDILHPYGKVGLLPWQGTSSTMEFGAEPNSEQLLQLAHDIKTFTEGTDPESSEILAIRSHIASAKRLVFIGFAFHKLNMNLISAQDLAEADASTIKVYSTTLGISESDKDVVSDMINDLYGDRLSIRMANVTCRDLFSEYWRSLSF